MKLMKRFVEMNENLEEFVYIGKSELNKYDRK